MEEGPQLSSESPRVNGHSETQGCHHHGSFLPGGNAFLPWEELPVWPPPWADLNGVKLVASRGALGKRHS